MNQRLRQLLLDHKRIFKHRQYSPGIEVIANKVKTELKLDTITVANIVSSQFAMVRDVIASSSDKKGLEGFDFDNFKSIRLIYLGAFLPSKFKFKKLVKKLKQRENEK